MADDAAHHALGHNTGAGVAERYRWIRRALELVRDHSRNPATRAEASRLIGEAAKRDPFYLPRRYVRLPLPGINTVNFNWGDFWKGMP